MNINEYLRQGTTVGDEVDKLDPVLLNMLEKGMKQIYINHARKHGATEEWLATLEPMGSMSVAHVVRVLYGEPP